MPTLRELVSDAAKRQQMIDEWTTMIDVEVSEKSGLSGMAIKTAYAMAKGLAPGQITKLVNGFLDQFMDALQPFYEEAKQKGANFKQHLLTKPSDVANALLKVTDDRAARVSGGALKKGYDKLRPTAQKHVEQALARVGDAVAKVAG